MAINWKKETLTYGIYFYRDDEGKFHLDTESIEDELNRDIAEILEDKEKQDKYLI
jgi:hypothetical protein